MVEGSEGSSAAELDSVVAVELERRVFWRAGISDSSAAAAAFSTGEVKGEMLATRWAVGMRVRKVWDGLDILDFCVFDGASGNECEGLYKRVLLAKLVVGGKIDSIVGQVQWRTIRCDQAVLYMDVGRALFWNVE